MVYCLSYTLARRVSDSFEPITRWWIEQLTASRAHVFMRVPLFLRLTPCPHTAAARQNAVAGCNAKGTTHAARRKSQGKARFMIRKLWTAPRVDSNVVLVRPRRFGAREGDFDVMGHLRVRVWGAVWRMERNGHRRAYSEASTWKIDVALSRLVKTN